MWRRNFLVWRKLAVPSMLGNLADPLIYMLGLGYGLGAMLPEVDGVPYIAFLAAGTVCFSTMNSATFEALYSALLAHARAADLGCDPQRAGLARRHGVRRARWGAAKSFLSGLAILLVAWALGLAQLVAIALGARGRVP